MALPTISLDDRSFEQLFTFMRRQIATDRWSDHNYSDAGVALLDLLCWIGEMVLYRANLVPDSHIAKFADFILDPPEPVTRQLTLTATVNPLRVTDLVVPAGTRFATDFTPATATAPARRFIFETIEPTTFRAPTSPQDATQERVTTARELMVIQNESLGFSDGTANQTFDLRPVRSDLGLPDDALAPVLLDFVHRSATYEPNPQVTVGGVAWELRQFLLTEDSWINPLTPVAKNHYMVDADTGAVRFGDNMFASIPPAGASIECTRYRVLQGPDALKDVPLLHQLDPVAGLMAGEAVTFSSGPAEGGTFFFRKEERIREGLKRFRRPFRLITAADFEQVMLIDFNEVLQLADIKRRVVRAVALMNQKPSVADQIAPGLGHVTIAVLTLDLVSTAADDLERALSDDTASIVSKNALISLAPDFVDRIVRFLDKRRLITTRVHIEPLTVEPISIALHVAVARDRDLTAMKDLIAERVTRFLGIVHGGFDGQGWPTGGDVHRSKIFRMVEDIDGVDHVESLTLSPSDTNGDVVISPLSVPALSVLSVVVNYI